jgi:hypothetical protein
MTDIPHGKYLGTEADAERLQHLSSRRAGASYNV